MSRDILITPHRGSTSSNLYPEIAFYGLTSSPIKLKVDDDGSVVYTGTYGALFNITDNKDGLLHSVNDISGLPILSVYSNDYVQMGKWNKNTFVVNSDKVGIGMTAPAHKLDISILNNQTAWNVSNGVADMSASIYSNRALIGSTSSNDIGFITNNSERLTILSSGNIGVGTISPSASLHIVGLGASPSMTMLSLSNPYQTIFNVYDDGNLYSPSTYNITTSTGTSSFLGIDSTGKLFNTNISTLTTSTINGTGSINYISKFTGTHLIGNSLIYDDGTNVGIATASPTARLHVKGIDTTFSNYALKLDNSASLSLMSIANNGKFISNINTDSNSWEFTNTVGTAIFKIDSQDYSMFQMFAAGSQKYFFEAGNGVNLLRIMCPYFEIRSNANNPIETFDGVNETIGVGITPTSDTKFYIKGVDSSTSKYTLKLDNSTSSPLLYVRNDGYVGVGVNNPTARLDILGGTANDLLKINNANFSFADKLRVTNDGSFYSSSINTFGNTGAGTFITEHLDYTFRTAYQTYFAFTNAQGAGNKGGYGIIGSTIANADSDYRLVVLNNDAGTIGSILKLVSTVGNSGNDGFDYYHYGVNLITQGTFSNFGSGTYYKVGLNVNISGGDVNYAAILNGGYVGINNNTPTATLHAIGNDTTFSNYALKIDNSSSVSLFSVANNGSVGINAFGGDTSYSLTMGSKTTGALRIFSSGFVDIFNFLDNGGLSMNTSTSHIGLGILNNPNIRLHIVGFPSGTGNVLLTSNSLGTVVGISQDYLYNTGFGTQAQTAKVHIVGTNSVSTGAALKIDNSTATSLLTVNNDGYIYALPTYGATSSATASGLLGIDSTGKLFNTGVSTSSIGGGGGTFSGSGTTNYISKFTGTYSVGNSIIYDSGSNIGIGTASPTSKVHIVGTSSLSTGTAFKIDNTSATSLFTIRNDGYATIMDMVVGRGGGLISTNTVLGVAAIANASGGQNTAIGFATLNTIGSGASNTAIGYAALANITTGTTNVAIGAAVMQASNPSYSIGIGGGVLYQASGSGNTGIGHGNFYNLSNGSYNTSLGYNAGASVIHTTGSNNVFIGAYADINVDGLTNAIAIGYNTVVSASNSMVLGNGVNVGIGTASPAAKLHIKGIDTTSSNYSLKIDDSTNTQLFHVRNDGYIFTLPTYGVTSSATASILGIDITGKIFNTGISPLSIGGGGGSFSGSGTTNYISKFTGANSVGDSLIYDNGSAIGIGTASPTSKLHIVGTNSLSSGFSFKADSSTTNILSVRNDGFVSIGGSSIGAAKLEITGGSYQGMYILSSGQIGVNAVDNTGIANKAESSTGTAYRANITNINGVAIDLYNTASASQLFKVLGDGKVYTPQTYFDNTVTGTASILGIDSTGKLYNTGVNPTAINIGTIGITIDGGGSPISAGYQRYVVIPYDCIITSWYIIADVSGDIVIDIWKDTSIPTVLDTIAGSEKPTLSSQQNNSDTNLTTWTTNVSSGDIIGFNVDSASTVQSVSLIMKIIKT